MPPYALLYLAAGLLVVADASKDLKNLEGTWILMPAEDDSKNSPMKRSRTPG